MKRQVTKAIAIKDCDITIVDTKKYYGILDSSGNRGFITKNGYKGNKFLTLSASDVTIGNGWGAENKDLASLINILIERGLRVYEFDTPSELFLWVSGNID